MTDLNPTDFAALAAHLREVFRGVPVEGYVVGRTRLRAATAEHLKCSQAEAERLVETMIARGIIVFERALDGAGPGGWHVHSAPAESPR
jgi:hypothetical protein